jgi:hypothetical protein
MSGRGDEPKAEALQIIKSVVQRVDFQLAAIAGTGIYFTD